MYFYFCTKFLSDDTLDVQVAENDYQLFQDDPDFKVNDESTAAEPLVIDSIYEAVTYNCCTVASK